MFVSNLWYRDHFKSIIFNCNRLLTFSYCILAFKIIFLLCIFATQFQKHPATYFILFLFKMNAWRFNKILTKCKLNNSSF